MSWLRMLGLSALVIASLAGVSGCGGSGGRAETPATGASLAVLPGASSAPRSTTASNVTVSFQIPAAASSNATLQALKRKPAFVSSGTDGVVLSAYLHSDTTHANPIASAVYNVSSGSSICTGTTTRTCALTLGVSPPSGASVDLVVLLYASAPVNGAIPANAALLGTGTLSAQTIAANAQNAFTITVLGVPAAASIALAPPGTATLGRSATLPLIVTVFDASGATIQGTYATPLTLTTSDTTGATSFTVNGNPGTTIAASTDTANLVYSGAALASATIGLSGTGLGAGTVTTLAFAPNANPPTASSSTIALSQAGTTTSATVTISESGYTGSFTSSGCSGIATVTPQTASGGSQVFTIAAGTSTGSCSLTFTDTNAQSVIVTVTVTGALMASPTTLSFVSGTTTPKTFTATETGYTGTLTASSSCGSIATVSPATATGSPATFTVTPGATGTCSITVRDSLGNTTVVTATVASPLSFSPASVTLPTDGNVSSPFTVYELGFTGSFTFYQPGSTCGVNIASVSPNSASGPSAQFTVSRIYTSSGTCTIEIVDSQGQSIIVPVTAPALQPLSATPATVTMPTNGTTTATFTINESGYIAAFTPTTNTCGTFVTVSGGTGGTYTLSRGRSSGSCSLSYTDIYGQSVSETVIAPALNAVSLSASVVSSGFARATFTESGYAGDATYSTTCADANLSDTSTVGSPASITVTTTNVPQTCSLQVLDAYGQEATATLNFPAVGPLTASPGTLTIATGASGTITVSDPGLNGSISSSASSCANVATVSPAATAGATGTFTVTGVAVGSCTLTFSDQVGNSTTVAVTVVTPQITITPGTAGYNEFTETLPTNGQTSLAITASEPGYSGTFNVTTSGCTGGTLPLVSPTSGATTFTLYRPFPSTTTTGCGFYIVDSNSNSVEVSVTAPAPNALSLSYSNITLATIATFSAMESGYTYGSGFTVTNGCASAGITVNGLGLNNGSETFNLNNGASTSGTCAITVTDAYGQSQSINVTYGPAP